MGVSQLTIVGGGNGTHSLAVLAASRGIEVRIWTPIKEEAEKLQLGIQEQGGIKAVINGEIIMGRPRAISYDPAEVIPDSEVIILVLPAFAHKEQLIKIKPYLCGNSIVGAMPSRSGFEFAARSILGENITIFGLQTLPWACRIRDYGKRVDILGTKKKVNMASSPRDKSAMISAMLEKILGIKVEPLANMLAISLGNMGQIIHPGIMYGLFHNWNGKAFPEKEIPLFYQGVSEEIAELLLNLSKEVMEIKSTLEQKSAVNLKGVLSLEEWILMSYEDSIEDKSSLQRCFSTNKSYQGLKAPVRFSEQQGYIPDFASRYLTEDVPYGLVVTRGFAQLSGTKSPVIDEIITETSKWMGKEYLVDGVLKGRDMKDTAIPQNYGIDDLVKVAQVVS